MSEQEKILQLVQVFDEWLATASEEQIRENCREQGSVFFRFLEERGVNRGWTAKLIQRATGYSATKIWSIASAIQVKAALNSYYLSMRAVDLEEAETGQPLNYRQTQRIVRRFWE